MKHTIIEEDFMIGHNYANTNLGKLIMKITNDNFDFKKCYRIRFEIKEKKQ